MEILNSLQAIQEQLIESQEKFLAEITAVLARLQSLEEIACDKIREPRIRSIKIKLSESAIIEAREENIKHGRKGFIRVGKIAGRFTKGTRYPTTDGYINIVVCSINKTSLGCELTPFVLADSRGRLMENLWQFSKIYKSVRCPSSTSQQIKWSWPNERHVSGSSVTAKNINQKYWKWRKAGMNHSMAIRHPVDTKIQPEGCLWSSAALGKNMTFENLDKSDSSDFVDDEHFQILGYVDSRIQIYCPLYMLLAKRQGDFQVLQHLLDDGYNIQILDIDGPTRVTGGAGESIFPYNFMGDGEYGESGVGSIPITEEIIHALINDVMQPFGHGYALAVALIGKEEWIHNAPNRIDN